MPNNDDSGPVAPLALNVPQSAKLTPHQPATIPWFRRLPPYALSAAIALALAVLGFILPIYKALDVWAQLLLALTGFLVPATVESHMRWRAELNRYQPIRDYCERLLYVLKENDSSLASYARVTLRHGIQAMEKLLSGDSVETTYAEQIAIARSLAGSSSASGRFWATSTDRPSVLWKEGIFYFGELAARTPNDPHGPAADGPPHRARIMVLSRSDLLVDFRERSAEFQGFCDWHADHRFELRFYFVDEEAELDDLVQRIVIGDANPLKDFLIKDDHLVFGRTKALPGNRVELKQVLNRDDEEHLGSFQSYCHLFENMWRSAVAVEHVLKQLALASQKEAAMHAARKEFSDAFRGALAGEAFLYAVCQRIADAKHTVHAVDVADRKQGASSWSFAEEYQAFLQASLKAAKSAEARVVRIFVIRRFERCLEGGLRHVILTQLKAGIEIVLIEDNAVVQNQLNADDFILIDEDLGFQLGDEEFAKERLDVGKNLIPNGLLGYYRDVYAELYARPEAKHFAGERAEEDFRAFLEEFRH